MTSRRWLILALALAGCGGDEKLPGPLAIEGWTPSGQAEAGAMPESLGGMAPKEGVRYSYRGDGDLTVTVLRMAGPSSAFEALQKWPPGEGRVFFQAGDLFVVVESAGKSAAQLREVADEVGRQIKK